MFLMILNAFNIGCKPANALLIIQVNWYPPCCYWVKCNTDEAARGAPGLAAYGGIFRDYSATTTGCYALHAE